MGTTISIGNRVGKSQDKSLSAYCTTLIKSLNPIFYIDNALNIVDSKFVDVSGNNKVLASSTTLLPNDTITLPANDTDIINALTLTGMYSFFYTDNATPKAIQIKDIRDDYSNYLIISRDRQRIALFASAVTGENIINLNKWKKLTTYTNRFTGNLVRNIDNTTFSYLIDTSNIKRCFTIDADSGATKTVSDNALAFSVTKKTLSFSITNSVANNGLALINVLRFCGKATLGLWIDKVNIPNNISWTVFNGSILLSPSQLTLNRTGSTTNFTWVIDAVNGTWVHFRIKGIASQNASVNKLLVDPLVRLGTYGSNALGTSYVIDFTDIVLLNDWVDIDITKDYGNVFSSKFNSKKLCVIGDSIGLGVWPSLLSTYLGTNGLVVAAKSGGRFSNAGGAGYCLLASKEAISGANADIYFIQAGGNDYSTPLGDINGTDESKFLDSYNLMLSYLTTNNPNAIIVMCTLVTNLWGVTNGVPGITEEQFNSGMLNTMNDGVRRLAAKYNLKICDLEGNKAYGYKNAKFFLSDGTHWSYGNDMAMANIMAQFIKDNY